MTTSTKWIAVGVLIYVAMTFAAIAARAATIDAASHSLLPNTAGQQVQMFVAGGGLVSGLDFFVQVGDGGAAVGGTNTGPTITNLDLTTGTIFAANNTGILTEHTPLIWTGTTTTMKGSVAANGLVATLTVDTTGLAHGEFPLILNPPSTGPTQLFGGGVTTSLISGSLHVVPAQGDFSLDGKLTNGDVQRMLDALHGLISYQSNNGLSDSDLRHRRYQWRSGHHSR